MFYVDQLLSMNDVDYSVGHTPVEYITLYAEYVLNVCGDEVPVHCMERQRGIRQKTASGSLTTMSVCDCVSD